MRCKRGSLPGLDLGRDWMWAETGCGPGLEEGPELCRSFVRGRMSCNRPGWGPHQSPRRGEAAGRTRRLRLAFGSPGATTGRVGSLDRRADRRQDLGDLAAEEDQGDDRHDRDEGEDQRVFRETLAVLVAGKLRLDHVEVVLDERHEAASWMSTHPRVEGAATV